MPRYKKKGRDKIPALGVNKVNADGLPVSAAREDGPAKFPMPGSKKISKDDPSVFSRARWRHAVRMFGAFIVIFLNIGLVMSMFERHGKQLPIQLANELVAILFVLFIDVIILLPALLEVDMARVADDGLVLKVLLFTKFIPWSDIKAFHRPRWLKVAILKTERCFYLINKRELRDFEVLAANIELITNPNVSK